MSGKEHCIVDNFVAMSVSIPVVARLHEFPTTTVISFVALYSGVVAGGIMADLDTDQNSLSGMLFPHWYSFNRLLKVRHRYLYHSLLCFPLLFLILLVACCQINFVNYLMLGGLIGSLTHLLCDFPYGRTYILSPIFNKIYIQMFQSEDKNLILSVKQSVAKVCKRLWYVSLLVAVLVSTYPRVTAKANTIQGEIYYTQPEYDKDTEVCYIISKPNQDTMLKLYTQALDNCIIYTFYTVNPYPCWIVAGKEYAKSYAIDLVFGDLIEPDLSEVEIDFNAYETETVIQKTQNIFISTRNIWGIAGITGLIVSSLFLFYHRKFSKKKKKRKKGH